MKIKIEHNWDENDDFVLCEGQPKTGTWLNSRGQIVIAQKAVGGSDEDRFVVFDTAYVPDLINSLLNKFYKVCGEDSDIPLPDHCNDLTDAIRVWRKSTGWDESDANR